MRCRLPDGGNGSSDPPADLCEFATDVDKVKGMLGRRSDDDRAEVRCVECRWKVRFSRFSF